MELSKIFHVKSEFNPADCGTRPGVVKNEDIGPSSTWSSGYDWMKQDMDWAIEQQIIKPAADMKVSKDSENDYMKGLMFESRVPEELTGGHIVNPSRVNLLETRANFSNYLILPTRYAFPKVVRILGLVMRFLTKFCKWSFKCNLMKQGVKFSAFNCVPSREFLTLNMPDSDNIDSEDEHISLALNYLFKKGSAEVREFNSKTYIKKHTIEKNGILLSRSRMVDGLNFQDIGELKVDLGSLGLKVNVPVLDRYSPLSLSIALHVHWKLAPHRGMETQHRVSLEHVDIIKGMQVFKELTTECIVCKKKRKKFLEVEMSGQHQNRLLVAPPFYCSIVDLFGPFKVYVPGREANTRSTSSLSVNVWGMIAVCPTSRNINLQVIETSEAQGVVDGFTRLSCEVGTPKYVFGDKDTAFEAAFPDMELTLRNLQGRLYREFEIEFSTCPVGGHNVHGHVERVIKSVKESLDDCGLKRKRIHATGLQTIFKIVENNYNNLPIGYHYDRDQDNTPVLKMITPNMLKMCRINSRALDGGIKIPRTGKDMMNRVEEVYEAWFKIFREVVVPKIMFRPKWYNSDRDLKEEDLVYFKKEADNDFDNNWTIGKIDQLERSRSDNKVRRVIVKYRNASENFDRKTDRTVRKLVKIFSIDEFQVQDDLTELEKRIENSRKARLRREAVSDEDHTVEQTGSLNEVVDVDSEEENGQESHAAGGKVAGVTLYRTGLSDTRQGNDQVLTSCQGVQEMSPVPQLQEDEPPFQMVRDGGRIPCSCCCDSHHKLTLHTMGPVSHPATLLPRWHCMMVKSPMDMRVKHFTGEIGKCDHHLNMLESAMMYEEDLLHEGELRSLIDLCEVARG